MWTVKSILDRGSLMTAEAGNLWMDVGKFQNTETGPIPIALHGPTPTHTHITSIH